MFDNRCEMIIVIDWQTMRDGLHEHSIANAHNIDLPVESYLRMACNAAIIPAVLDSNGVVLDLGRTTRLATKHQRRALLAMYDTCAIPGCTVNARLCEPHRILWWQRLGDPISTTSSRSAAHTTTTSTKVAGNSPSTATAA